jgi:predicted AAA+ superfamily ATPase
LYNCEALNNPDDIVLGSLFKDKKLVIIDEAQKVKNIGSVLKVIHDHIPEVQVIATGSSSFELSKQVYESGAGRNIEFHLYPLSMAEISQKYNVLQLNSKLNDILKY